MALRITLAVIVGGLLGLERERKSSPAGFRTYILVAIGSTMTVMLSQYLDFMLNHDWLATADRVGIKTDVSRFGAQVINGVGFLGAGTIIVTGRQEVKGLTTAAGLWASACMGNNAAYVRPSFTLRLWRQRRQASTALQGAQHARGDAAGAWTPAR